MFLFFFTPASTWRTWKPGEIFLVGFQAGNSYCFCFFHSGINMAHLETWGNFLSWILGGKFLLFQFFSLWHQRGALGNLGNFSQLDFRREFLLFLFFFHSGINMAHLETWGNFLSWILGGEFFFCFFHSGINVAHLETWGNLILIDMEYSNYILGPENISLFI